MKPLKSFKWDTRFCCLTVLSENNNFFFIFSFFKLLVFCFVSDHCVLKICITEEIFSLFSHISCLMLLIFSSIWKTQIWQCKFHNPGLFLSFFASIFIYPVFFLINLLFFQAFYLHPINTWLADSWAWNVVSMKLENKYINLGFSTLVSLKRNMEDFSLKDHVSRCWNLSHCHPVVIVLFINTLKSISELWFQQKDFLYFSKFVCPFVFHFS